MKKENEVITTEIVETETTAVVVMDDSERCFLLEGSGQKSYSSFVPKTMDEKKAFFNMINSPENKLGDYINMTLYITHVYVETCEYIDKASGELTPGVRIVMMDKDGHSYNTSSKGVFNSLAKIFRVFGEPLRWTEPIALRVKQISVASDRKVLTLEAA